jgi:hypothetical protein
MMRSKCGNVKIATTLRSRLPNLKGASVSFAIDVECGGISSHGF